MTVLHDIFLGTAYITGAVFMLFFVFAWNGAPSARAEEEVGREAAE